VRFIILCAVYTAVTLLALAFAPVFVTCYIMLLLGAVLFWQDRGGPTCSA